MHVGKEEDYSLHMDTGVNICRYVYISNHSKKFTYMVYTVSCENNNNNNLFFKKKLFLIFEFIYPNKVQSSV